MSDFLGTNDDTPDGENNIAIVHPAVMAPLLVWALRTVLDLSPDIPCNDAQPPRHPSPTSPVGGGPGPGRRNSDQSVTWGEGRSACAVAAQEASRRSPSSEAEPGSAV